MPTNDTDVALRLGLAMKHRGYHAAELARRSGCGRSAITNILNGHSSGKTLMHKLGEALGVSPYWLLTGESGAPEWLNRTSDGPAEYHIDLAEPREIPVIAYAGASSDGQRGRLAEIPELKRLPDNLALVAVRGQSAYPAIYDGQFAVVNVKRPVRRNNVVAVVLMESDDVLVKRWVPQSDGEHVVLASLDGGIDSLSVHTHEVRHVWPVVGVFYE